MARPLEPREPRRATAPRAADATVTGQYHDTVGGDLNSPAGPASPAGTAGSADAADPDPTRAVDTPADPEAHGGVETRAELVTAGTGRDRRPPGGRGLPASRPPRQSPHPPQHPRGQGQLGSSPDGGAADSGGGADDGAERRGGRGEPDRATAQDVLGGYLHDQAAELLRGLRLHGESSNSAEDAPRAAEAVRQLRRAARRLNGALHTFRPLFDTSWADQLRGELSWLSGTLALEYAYGARLDRLLAALHRLASDGGGASGGPAGGASQGTFGGKNTGDRRTGGNLPVGAARAGALLERQLTLSRTRAHSAALQALGSSRFHAVADAVAVLASESPLTPQAAEREANAVLVPLAEQARRRLAESVEALPLARAEAPYNAEALARSLATEAQQDAAWHQVRGLLRLHRYALEVVHETAAAPPEARLAPASNALERHRDAAEAAAAAAAAARTPRIAPATAYALGVLHADQRHEVEASRFAFGRLWSPAPKAPAQPER